MAKIVVFDSGIGGINILKLLVKEMPREQYLYIADTKNAPYGTQTQEKIISYCLKIGDAAERADTDILILACNTATAAAIDSMRKSFGFPIIGTEPELKTPLEKGGKTLLMLTPSAAESERVKKLKKDADISVWADPALATLIENAAPDFSVLREYIKKLPAAENYVLGCTHYIFLKDILKETFPGAKIFDGTQGVLKRIKSVYSACGLKESGFSLKIINTADSANADNSKYLSLIFQNS